VAHGLSLFRLTFLGTSAAQPTVHRNLSGLVVKADTELVLFDCGEGSQRQMARFGTGFSITTAFFTHFHADHYLGIIGFLRTLGMQGRTDELVLHGPRGAASLLDEAVHLGIDELSFPVHVRELDPGDEVARAGFTVRAVEADHRVSAIGYVVDEDPRPGRFDVARATALGVTPGPDFRRLQDGEPVATSGGTVVRPGDVLGPARRGRRVALSGDTRPTDALARAAAGADVLIHEATFSDEEQARAELTRHSTAREAGTVAAAAGAERLVLTHLSTRYDRTPERLAEEARAAFRGPVDVAYDGMTIELPLADP
jgi:ribonuclease Z